MNALIHRIFPLGVRLQLMLWYTAIFAALLLFTGAFFYQHLEHSLEASLDTTLQVRAQQTAGGITLVNGTITVRDVTGDLPGFDANPNDQRLSPVDANFGVLVRLLDARGQLVHETPAFRALRVPPESVTQPLQGTAWQGTVTTSDGQEVRLVSRLLSENGQLFAVIQVGESLAALHTLLHELVAELLVVGLLVLLACAIGSYWPRAPSRQSSAWPRPPGASREAICTSAFRFRRRATRCSTWRSPSTRCSTPWTRRLPASAASWPMPPTNYALPSQ